MRDTITYDERDNILFIKVETEECKVDEAERLIEIVFDIFGGEKERIILDLEKVNYMNSTAISAIGRISMAMNLKVIKINSTVKHIMDTLGFLPVLSVYEDENQAVNSFNKE